MAIERSPDYELYVARSDEEEHRAMLTSPSHAYRVGVGQSGEIEAFAILRGIGDPHLNLYLKRIAVARPGQGVGTAFLGLVLDEAFGSMGAERFHLDCFADNLRAQRSYRETGFHPRRRDAQSLSAGHGTRDGPVMMAILKSEWEARRSLTSSNEPFQRLAARLASSLGSNSKRRVPPGLRPPGAAVLAPVRPFQTMRRKNGHKSQNDPTPRSRGRKASTNNVIIFASAIVDY